MSLRSRLTSADAGYGAWLQANRYVGPMSGLLAFSVPVTFFVGDLSAMQARLPSDVIALGAWWLLYGAELWALLLIGGFGCMRLMVTAARRARVAIVLACAAGASTLVTLTTTGRTDVLVAQGVVQSVLATQLYAFTSTLTLVLLFLVHLHRSQVRAAAAARLAAAQSAQRDARHRIVQRRHAAIQARVDPQLLFGMLDAVRTVYGIDAARAERLLDELVAYLRAALPGLRHAWSSVSREAELARAFVGLHALALDVNMHLAIELTPEAMHARFPHGLLLPLLDDALRDGPGACALVSDCEAGHCRVLVRLPLRPSDAASARVRAQLDEVHGAAAGLSIAGDRKTFLVTIRVPHELA